LSCPSAHYFVNDSHPMTRIIARDRIDKTDSQTVISFVKTGTENWPVWNRFIYLDGKPAYEIGNICGTCRFYFERLDGASQNIESKYTIQQFNEGLGLLDPEVIATVSAIIPDGKYKVLLLEVYPKLVELGGAHDYFTHDQVAVWGIDGFYGLPHNPKIQYYRGTDNPMADEKKVFEFIIPIFPQGWLDTERVEHYKREIEAGKTPTAISLSVLDIKSPGWLDPDDSPPEFTEHWCLAHYLLDGHHKLYAASLLGKAIHLLAFVAEEECILNAEGDIDTLLQVI
jgi:hypothetical protein